MRDILVVEDGLHERERLLKLFSSANFTVSAVESAREAEQLLSNERFRLAILDIGLGDKSGSVLFEEIKRSKRISYVIIFTGNPSVHLKQRFIDDGAADYILKASPEAENEKFLEVVRGLLGNAPVEAIYGIPLVDFLQHYLSPASRELFFDNNNLLPPCPYCSSEEFIVSFGHKTQLPPIIEGRVICSKCRREMDPQVG